MNIYIYNPNSSGGNYEYALQLKKIYEKNSSFDCKLILPQNVKCKKKDQYFLLPDVSTSRYSFYNKWHFIKRTVLNPIKFYKYLNTAKSGIVLFNDFDQLSVPFWVRLFIKLKNKFKFGVLLHDPDRTNYPPHLVYASYTMSKLLSMMDFVYYHDILPDLSYYNNFRGLKIPVPHGLYYLPNPDIELKKRLIEWKGKKILLGILGNIREEKNYTLVIRALTKLPDTKLIIAGFPSSSSVSVEEYKSLAKNLEVYDRIFWFIDYLSDEQLSAVIQVVDLPLLYYKSTFASQSGIINLLAPFKKNVLISKTNSGLSLLAQKYGFGVLIEADNEELFIEGIKLARNKKKYINEWDNYLNYANWDTHVEIMNDLVRNMDVQ